MKSNFFYRTSNRFDLTKRLIFTLILSFVIPQYFNLEEAKAVNCSPTQTRVGNTIIQSFTTTTTCDWTVPAGVTSIRYLVVGGGGSGGSARGGGGGAGGLLRGNAAVTANQTLEIKVGVGGSGSTTPGSNTNGDTSTISGTGISLIAPGGGKGGSHNSALVSNDLIESGSSGGSGGGGSMNYAQVTNKGGSASGGSVSGNAGAGSTDISCASRTTNTDQNRNTGGGGGAGSAGVLGCNTTSEVAGGVAPDGGNGLADTITGTSVTYATGGGGAGGKGWNGTTCEASYFTSGAGSGGSSNVNGGSGQACAAAPATLNGSTNRGAGGGGTTSVAGGNGGSGIVIISYASTTPIYGGSCTAGSVTQTFDTSTGAQIEIFNAPAAGTANCSFIVPSGVVAVDYLVVAGGGGGASGGGGGGGVITNREVRNSSGSPLALRRSALAVRSSETISVTVGKGGDYNFGGSGTGSRSGITRDGGDSLFGSIRAIGGGGGGIAAGSGRTGGSSGGAAYDNNGGAATTVTRSVVTGASTFGNAGGTSSTSSYSAGGGGGGSASLGGAARRIPFHGNNGQTNPSNPASFSSCNDGGSTRGCFTFGGGGDGGAGVVTDIYSTSTFDTSFQFGCGGGGGVNNNSNETVTATITGGNLEIQGGVTSVVNFASGTYSGGGSAGCSTSGRGSSYGGNSIANNRFNGTSAAVGYGGGGGGTDPESNLSGNGGSGIVVISYFVNNSACPNNGVNATSTRPLACNFTVSIRAGKDTVTVDARGNPYSYSDTPTTTARITIGVDSITITVSNNQFIIHAPGTNNPLRGGTYPALYSLTTTGTDTSSAYVLVNVTDPDQHTPTKVGINPWVTTFKVPPIVFGTISAVLVCINPRASTVSRYGNLPTVTMSSVVSNALRTDLPNGGIKLEGTVESITANASNFRIVKSSSDSRLLPGTADRLFDVNVSNTATGGNGSCTGGSESTLTIYRLNYEKKNTKNLPLKNGKQ
jgi:hypothetical protein